MNVTFLPPNPLHGDSLCSHGYKISRVVMRHPEGGYVVLGDDNRFHVVHQNCVQNSKGSLSTEIQISTR